MDRNLMKSLIKSVVWGVFWSIILIFMGFIIINLTTYNLKDVLFIEGLIVVIFGAASSISGDSMGLSLQALGQNNAQYVANANLEVTKMEKEKPNMKSKSNLRIGLNKVSLIIGGAICIIVNYII